MLSKNVRFIANQSQDSKASHCSIGADICNTYAIEPVDLAFKWEALAMNRTRTATGSLITGLDMDAVVQLREKVRDDLPKNQEQVRHQQSVRSGARPQVRQTRGRAVPFRAGGGAGIRQSTTTGLGKSALNKSGAASAPGSLSFPIKICDNVEDRNCTCNESFYMHDYLMMV
jgi:hypothetical protein